MEIDPKKIIEIGGEVIDSFGLIKRVRSLFPGEKSGKTRRRTDWDPEKDGDRRQSGVDLRLKTGIWLHFHRKTGLGKFQELGAMERENLMRAFHEEAVHYQFIEHGSSVPLQPSTIASLAADDACAKMAKLPYKKRQAVLLTDSFAEYILARFTVRMLDQRKGPRKQAMAG